ncbi:molybdopterin molybdochelatase [Hoeflea marina]|uniref:Molybdopterin molybdenumtransferase n=1 Tax=Hoeflea marina TaxID=274592 RepID=A0A317PQE2_9HYPH|nr:gephyrin-like molybdotransferase Glp [Hoeflea marina]PWW03701.1 molybdopterin molybdochelatase [Hoeflea marina]
MALMPVEQAFERIVGDAEPLTRTEPVTLADALGRVLARDLLALRTQPPFAASAMDGYALRAEDAARAGAELDVTGESAAGHGFDGRVGPGEAVRIFTGAPMPEGADSILIQENAEIVRPGRIRITAPVEAAAYVRPDGMDFSFGDAGLPAGRVLDPTAITLAAGMNHPMLSVLARPRVAILATGDELRLPGQSLAAGQIIASNTFGVAAMARRAGAEIIDLGIAADRMDALDSAIDSAISQGADILVTIGGASVGDHDLVQKALVGHGMNLDFWRIAMRPGKPLMSGSLGPMRVLGLPGNPASSMVCGLLFLEPLVARLAGLPAPARLKSAFVGRELSANDQRQDYLRARLDTDPESGRLTATPFDQQDSSLMRLFADADCLLIRPPHAPAARIGETCSVLVLRP